MSLRQTRENRPPAPERTGQEEQRHDRHLRQRRERLYPRYPGRRHYAERGHREGQQHEFSDYGQDQNRVAGNARKAGQAQNDDSREGTKEAAEKMAVNSTNIDSTPRWTKAPEVN